MSDDTIGDLLSIAGAFDWITPITRTLLGWNTLEYAGPISGAIAVQLKLEDQGIETKLEGCVLSDEWMVVSKRKRPLIGQLFE